MPQTLMSSRPRELDALRDELAEAHARIAELERLADTDPLTELPNRRPFVRAIDRAIRQCDRHGTPSAVMFADVDGLKAINDEFGHAGGDAALRQVAKILAREVRASDLVARIGGDEFGLVLDHLDEGAARAKAAVLAGAVRIEPLAIEGHTAPVRLSFGVACVRNRDTVEAVIARADTDMYAAKRAQRSDK